MVDFPYLTTIPKIDMTLPIKSCEAERNFSKLSITKNKFWSTMLEERLSVPFIENDIIKLSCEEAIREYAAKKKMYFRGLSGS